MKEGWLGCMEGRKEGRSKRGVWGFINHYMLRSSFRSFTFSSPLSCRGAELRSGGSKKRAGNSGGEEFFREGGQNVTTTREKAGAKNNEIQKGRRGESTDGRCMQREGRGKGEVRRKEREKTST